MADGLGIARSTYYDYEQNNVSPKVDFLYKAAAFFKVDPVVFISEQGGQVRAYDGNISHAMMERWMKDQEERYRRFEELLAKTLERSSEKG